MVFSLVHMSSAFVLPSLVVPFGVFTIVLLLAAMGPELREAFGRVSRKRIVSACVLALILATTVVCFADEGIIYQPIPCSEVPWWLLPVRPDCW